MTSHLHNIRSKIFQREQLGPLCAFWKFKGYKIVFTNGCFDILHRGHIEYLAKAKKLGEILFIGLNTDESVKRLKGADRPFQDEDSRAVILASLKFVDYVSLFHEDTPYELIKKVQPDVLVKGSDYKPEEIAGFDIVKAKGGIVKTIDFVEGFSSTSLIQKFKKT
ncbi:MAG: D-glycero-beta-D-manno-heptose 1-phosphate adenylyltransferase [Bacteroidales bacterium]|nr:D-glycero-beta-D-manno-heptose 1-phosphate adenylyltransferase [Bacteroidales bacterium]